MEQVLAAVVEIFVQKSQFTLNWDLFQLTPLTPPPPNKLQFGQCRAMKTKGMVFRYTWIYSNEDTMAHTRRPVVTS